MTDITISNFNEKFLEIKACLQQATFISIDLEFSALHPLKNHSPSLFDSPNERYTKLRKNTTEITPIQVGLTSFSIDSKKNTYIGTVYNFHVVPASFPTINKAFYFQSDTLHFLKLYGFDFNKWVYEGIPYMNRDQETELRRRLKNGITYNQCSCMSELEEILGNELVKKWYHTAKDGDKFSIPNLYERHQHNFEFLYFIHRHFRSRFKCMWTAIENGEFVVKKVTSDEYKTLEEENDLEESLINNLLGFTKIFRILTSLKKPIVGHNLLQDILLMVNSFETALPVSYAKFKTLVTRLFPTVFDTKVLTYDMKHLFPGHKQWTDSGLKRLFNFFQNESEKRTFSHTLSIESAADSYKFHEAGWDSFCTGYVFLQLAYLNVYKEFPCYKYFTSSELFAALSKWKNYANVIRGSISSIKLDGKDPNSTRPPYLVVESIKNRAVDISQVAYLLSSFGFVELRRFYHNKRVLVAVDNFGNARRILESFKTHDEFRIKRYNAIKHSPVVKAAVLGGITVCGVLLIFLTHAAIRK